MTYINNTFLHTTDKNNSDNNMTPIFIGLHKTTQVSNIKATTKIQTLWDLTITKFMNVLYLT
jgi:hypothetical protein